MRVLLKGGYFHNYIVAVPNWKTELLMPIPQEITAAILDEDPMVPNLDIERYIKSSMQGYGNYNDVYWIWVYDGKA